MLGKTTFFLKLLFLFFFLDGLNAALAKPFSGAKLNVGNSIKNRNKIFGNVLPGIYILNITSSISSGVSSQFTIYSETGIDVNVDTSISIENTGSIPVTWTPSAGAIFNVVAILSSIYSPSSVFKNVTIPDSGMAEISVSQFGSTIASGEYSLTIVTPLGAGISNTFLILSQYIDVTLSNYSVHIGKNISVYWRPFECNETANIYVRDMNSEASYHVAKNISDKGYYNISLGTIAAGAYKVEVVSSIGSGSSRILYISKASLNVTAIPSNVYAVQKIFIVWKPIDRLQKTVELSIYKASSLEFKVSVPNIGIYSFIPDEINIEAGEYTSMITSKLGVGITSFSVYSPIVLNVTEPNASVVYKNTTTSLPVQWSSSGVLSGKASIKLIDVISGYTYNFTAVNNGFLTIDLSTLGILNTSHYKVVVTSTTGKGSSQEFSILAAGNIVETSASDTVGVSNVGTLNITWVPVEPPGQNITIWIFQPDFPSIVYGPFSFPDSGLATINLSDLMGSKTPKTYQTGESIFERAKIPQYIVSSPDRVSKKALKPSIGA
ncbi:hypothetical protein DI09_220p30 [Mitosporidium daphniae]|uniref:Fibronectin type-III domain-containing protein n=1 Tax=Mitosporidium daphniae TaxID=1485682 RepID=A0A098VSG8_9MICR|nr:uncharacterized protein DI09_220p30 [Mitosporidium daphniae]KGG52028.1 hypothetical protein DI09_220p30 [Mitosporidium daphniae]|eukprot:XP_013238464.1 uncharacterized protein DI09_220p30 [Mitosporidium daphniae]